MSKREIEQRFTKSEITITAWRSQEISHQMRQKYEEADKPKKEPEVEVNKMTFNQAMAYFRSIGLEF